MSGPAIFDLETCIPYLVGILLPGRKFTRFIGDSASAPFALLIYVAKAFSASSTVE
jgi:hypothetical protein